MKRVVDGVAYNTDTSTLLAKTDWEDRDDRGRDQDITASLYETKKGAFFLHKVIVTTWVEEDRYGHQEQKRREQDIFLPMTATEAKEWMLKGDVEIIHDRFAEGVPEAEAEETEGASIFLRLPASLKQRVEKAAATDNVSINAYALKCLERCLLQAAAAAAAAKIPALPKRNSNAS